jgi:hypothetical protein
MKIRHIFRWHSLPVPWQVLLGAPYGGTLATPEDLQLFMMLPGSECLECTARHGVHRRCPGKSCRP